MARIPEDEVERLKRRYRFSGWPRRGASSCTDTVPTCWVSAPSTTTAIRRLSSLRRRTCGTALGRATRADGHRLGNEGQRHQLPPCGRVAARRLSSFSRRSIQPVKHGTVRKLRRCSA